MVEEYLLETDTYIIGLALGDLFVENKRDVTCSTEIVKLS
jgi:hypothetical protein